MYAYETLRLAACGTYTWVQSHLNNNVFKRQAKHQRLLYADLLANDSALQRLWLAQTDVLAGTGDGAVIEVSRAHRVDFGL